MFSTTQDLPSPTALLNMLYNRTLEGHFCRNFVEILYFLDSRPIVINLLVNVGGLLCSQLVSNYFDQVMTISTIR